MSTTTIPPLNAWVDGGCARSLALAQLSCGYRNSSDRMVIVRCLGPEEFFLERVVFPFELLSFLAPPQSVVEIWTHGLGGPELLESLDVACLNVERSAAPEPLPEPIATATTGPWQQGTVNRWADAVSQAS